MNSRFRSFLSVIALAILITSCGDSKTTDANGRLTSFDACSCAGVKDQAGEDYKKCKELRAADPKFEADFQQCSIAQKSGLDTSQITLQNAATATNLLPAGDGTFVLDAASSKLTWRGEKVTGKKHSGSLNVKNGSFTMSGGNLTAGEVVIDMTSLTVTDQQGEGKTKLETHLKSDDFFGTASHNEARFTVKSATKKTAQSYEVKGSLTIKGITKDAVANLVIAPNMNDAVVGGSVMFDRSQFEVRYGSDAFFDNLGDDMIKDEVILTFDLKAKKQ